MRGRPRRSPDAPRSGAPAPSGRPAFPCYTSVYLTGGNERRPTPLSDAAGAASGSAYGGAGGLGAQLPGIRCGNPCHGPATKAIGQSGSQQRQILRHSRYTGAFKGPDLAGQADKYDRPTLAGEKLSEERASHSERLKLNT